MSENNTDDEDGEELKHLFSVRVKVATASVEYADGEGGRDETE